jgi:hypothetical protein
VVGSGEVEGAAVLVDFVVDGEVFELCCDVNRASTMR